MNSSSSFESVTGVDVGGKTMKYVPNLAVIDSGTSYFYLPQDLFREIQQKYFKDCVYYQGIPVCSCS